MITGKGQRRTKVVEGHAGENRLQQYYYYLAGGSCVRSKGVSVRAERNSMRRSIKVGGNTGCRIDRGARGGRTRQTVGGKGRKRRPERRKRRKRSRKFDRYSIDNGGHDGAYAARPRPGGQWRRFRTGKTTNGILAENANGGGRAKHAAGRTEYGTGRKKRRLTLTFGRR